MAEEKTIIKIEHGAYEAKDSSLGMAVYSPSWTAFYSDGSRSMKMRFPICVITEYMEDQKGLAEGIASVLSEAEGLPCTETPPPADQPYRKGEAA